MSPTIQVSSKHLEGNRQGIFALPHDTAESYAQKIDILLHPEKTLDHASARELVKARFDIDPVWVPVGYAKDGLYPWEAGCLWHSEDPMDVPSIQLAPRFEHSFTYLGLYKRDEVLAHEYVHAVRASLCSSQFEELFAYLVSLDSSRSCLRYLRTFLGPIFEKPIESLLFVVLMALFTVVSILGIDELIFYAALLTVGAVAYLFGRLFFRWRLWYLCRQHLRPLVGEQTLAFMLRLRDEEIVHFSAITSQKIAEWIALQAEGNFRWALLSLAYVKGMFSKQRSMPA